MEPEKSQIEPIFKYIRIASDLKDILKIDSISAINVTSKILFLGTSWGELYLLDHEGNAITEQKFPKHMVSINMISVDARAEYIATCSDDGKVRDYFFV